MHLTIHTASIENRYGTNTYAALHIELVGIGAQARDGPQPGQPAHLVLEPQRRAALPNLVLPQGAQHLAFTGGVQADRRDVVLADLLAIAVVNRLVAP